MKPIKLNQFLGMRPAIHETLLDIHNAQVASDCRVEGGRLSPLRGMSTVQATTTTGTALSIYKYTSGWFEWTTDVDVVSSLIANDAWDRRIFTGDGAPKFTENTIATSGAPPYPVNAYLLGVPPPGYVDPTFLEGQAPGVALVGSPDDPLEEPETRFYVLTSVDAYGAEGAPGPVSVSVEWRTGQTVDVTIPSMPAGNYNIASYRVYRSNTGTSSSVFQYVGTDTNFGGTFNDAVDSDLLGEALSTENFALPDPDMIGIVELPNNFLAGFSGNTVMFSEPGFPHAWPVAYQLVTKAPIVSLGVFGNNLLVTTTDKPYLITGVDPAGMSMDELESIEQACVSKRGTVTVRGGVVYPSPDGLVMVSSEGARLITQGVFTRDQWQALSPSSIHACSWEGNYLFFYDTGAASGGYVIDPSRPEAGVLQYTDYVDEAYTLTEDDAVYVVHSGNIKTWDTDTGNLKTLTWRSKKFEQSFPDAPRLARVRADGYPVTLKVYGDGALIQTKALQNKRPDRLDSAGSTERYVDIEAELVTTETVHDLTLTSVMRDMKETP